MKGVVIIGCFLLIILGLLSFLELRDDAKGGTTRNDSSVMGCLVVLGVLAIILFFILI